MDIKYKIKFLLLIFIVAISFSSFAQKNPVISGIIKDSETGETLIGASVQLSGANQIGTVSNAYGFYSLNVAKGVYKVIFSYVGYQTISQDIDVDGDKQINISLVSLNQLSEVVVNAERKDENVVSAQMGVQKLNVKEINSIPA
jgi:hypothetical protein